MNPFEKNLTQTPDWRGSTVLATVLLLASCLLTPGFGTSQLLLARIPTQTNQAPAGWSLAGSNPTSYRTGVDRATAYEGRPSAYLQSNASALNGFGTLMQSIDAANYAGKRVRLRASVESQDVTSWAGMWMRVDKQKTTVAFDNMQDRAIKGTHPWNTYDVVLDVPEDATSISFGILLMGGGQVWINHVTLEPVSDEIKATAPSQNQKPLSKAPVNLNFSE
ncbi:hypothetical protein RBB77_03735 [Tunturibacter psychrotolerans]|uniref:Transcriptional regulator n=1 Tax=Tunturiibacter psychrotolerans TaxID=3069686 RepID=A0AAU7ZSV7_9BACT